MNPLFGGASMELAETQKAVTPFGGLAVFAEFLQRVGWTQVLREHWPFQYRSPNAIAPEQTLTVFLCAVLVGARRFAHAAMLRADRALHALLGLKRCPGDDAIRAMFNRFGMGEIEALFRPLWRWMLERVPKRPDGYTLDVDSTVITRFGKQQGAARGYNPARKGGRSHHPLIGVLAESQCVIHGWLRSGDTTANSGVLAFLRECFALAEQSGTRITRFRADCGYYGQDLLQWLEAREISYVIIARQTGRVLRLIQGITHWQRLANGDEVGEFTATVGDWKKPRRFVVLRRLKREDDPKTWLLPTPRYTYRVMVTNGTASPAAQWEHYDQRAQIELRLRELKEDLNVDGFALRSFHGTEAAFLSILCLYNLLTEFQRAAAPKAPLRQPGTLRNQVFVCGAVLGRKGHHRVLYFSMAWGGLESRKALLDAILLWPPPSAPFLNPSKDPPPKTPS